MTDYTALYEVIRPGVRRSAEALVPVMAEWYDNATGLREDVPSVVDVGCGEGWWGLEWVIAGYADHADGIDGPWPGAGVALTAGSTVINRNETDFIPMRLDAINPGWTVDPQYDIALCLEVAEHLDNPDTLLGYLRKLAPVVFFSAAVPDQPGAGHVSCRWQSDWARDFRNAGWWTYDLRRHIWDADKIEWWYRQNLFVAYDPHHPNIDTTHNEPIMSMVHPDMWAVRHECR